MEALLGASVVGKDGGDVATSSLQSNTVVGLYFSAHWCPPCRGFTPVLAEYYQKLRAAGKTFEIVFVSSDRDEEACNSYYKDMPWLMVPYSKSDLKNELAEKYKVSGIPTLVLLDGTTGEIIQANGRETVTSDKDGSQFPWKE